MCSNADEFLAIASKVSIEVPAKRQKQWVRCADGKFLFGLAAFSGDVVRSLCLTVIFLRDSRRLPPTTHNPRTSPTPLSLTVTHQSSRGSWTVPPSLC